MRRRKVACTWNTVSASMPVVGWKMMPDSVASNTPSTTQTWKCSNGLVSLVLAPFGAHAINLAAITAAICTGPEAHHNPAKRYIAGMACGFFYLLIGAFGGTLVALFTALPKALVACVAGLALFGAILNGLSTAKANEKERDSALLTFLVTASGVTLLGLGAAFWGLVAGVAMTVYGRRKAVHA